MSHVDSQPWGWGHNTENVINFGCTLSCSVAALVLQKGVCKDKQGLASSKFWWAPIVQQQYKACGSSLDCSRNWSWTLKLNLCESGKQVYSLHNPLVMLFKEKKILMAVWKLVLWFQKSFYPLAWKAIGGYCNSKSVFVYMYVVVCMYVSSSLVRFLLFECPSKRRCLITTKLGSKMQYGFLHMLMRSKSHTKVKGHLRSS